MNIACLQLSYPAGESPSARVDRVVRELERGPDADLVVLPELWDVGYFAFDGYEAWGKPLDAGPLRRLAAVAQVRGLILVAGSVLERDGGALHNTVSIVGPQGELLGAYRKRHLFAYASRERELLSPGDASVVVPTPLGRIGIATCFDLRFPEQFAEMREMGADLFVVPAAWPAARIGHWDVLTRARAIETQTPLAACNGVGDCSGVELGGSSRIVDARGEVRGPLSVDPGWTCAEIDPEDAHAYRSEFPLRDPIG
ncbi:MAG TPA: nitrilase-related carbon-nitrogen hydrolase [Actinomycetota bacterium]|jgi:predicted amidohydrolase